MILNNFILFTSTGLLYAGLEYSYECWCGNIERAIKLDDSECNMPCNGNSLQMCGGALALSVYHTGFGGKITFTQLLTINSFIFNCGSLCLYMENVIHIQVNCSVYLLLKIM